MLNLMTSIPAEDNNNQNYTVNLFDIDDCFIQTDNLQNNQDTTNDPQSCTAGTQSYSELSNTPYGSLDLFANDVKLPDEEIIYIISKNANLIRCETCDIHCSNTFDLVKHQRVHTKTFNCLLCNDRFSNTYGLKRHMLRSHRRERHHQCLECGKAFHQLGHLTAHTRVHTGEKPYICTVCQKTFAHYANLITHRKIHGQERSYECEICTRQFMRASNLIEHRKIHGGNKPYGCDMCENTYKRNSHLIEHKRIHTGERPYKCDLCGETFTRCSGLNKHKKRYHQNINNLSPNQQN